MQYFVKQFSELSLQELYQILQLRGDIFIVEQNCPYPDVDGKDPEALHVFGVKDNQIVTYTRIFDGGKYFDESSLGRVAVKASERKYGYGHELIDQSILAIYSHFGKVSIKIAAQTYLTKFYEKHGFVSEGEEFLEDDIPHIHMIKSKPS